MTDVKLERLVKQFRAKNWPIKKICAHLGITKYKVEKIIYPSYASEPKAKIFEEQLKVHRKDIHEWLEQRNIPVSLVVSKLKEKGLKLSNSTIRRYIKSISKPEVYVPVTYLPGQQAQVDFGYIGRFNKDGKDVKAWVFCMVLSYSKYAFYKVVTDQTVKTFLSCHREAFEYFGGVPASILIDNLGAGVLQADFYQPVIQQQYAEMLEHYGCTVLTARICRGQDKGIVESGIKYVKNSFLKSITTKDFGKMVNELVYWNKIVCNLRDHKTTHKIPNEEFLLIEKGKLKQLPLQRYEIFEFEERTVNTFGHIYHGCNQYSVPHYYSGERVRLAVNDQIIKVYKDGEQIAMHVLSAGKGNFITEENHKPLYKRAKTPQYYSEILEKFGSATIELMNILIQQKPLEWKRMCNGIIRLGNTYSSTIINQACRTAINRRKCEYRFVKEECEILRKEPDKVVEPKRIKGYAHDLKMYDKFVTTFQSNSL